MGGIIAASPRHPATMEGASFSAPNTWPALGSADGQCGTLGHVAPRGSSAMHVEVDLICVNIRRYLLVP